MRETTMTDETLKLSHSTKLTDIVTLHGQLLASMANRRSYEQLIHAGLWAGLGLTAYFLISTDIPFNRGVSFAFVLVLFLYGRWVIFISQRQLQDFKESRKLREIIYQDSDGLTGLDKLKPEGLPNSWEAFIDPPASLRILVTALLIFGIITLWHEHEGINRRPPQTTNSTNNAN